MTNINNLKKNYLKSNIVLLSFYIILSCLSEIINVFFLVWIVNRILTNVIADNIKKQYIFIFLIFLIISCVSIFISGYLKELLRRKLIYLIEDDILNQLTNGIQEKNKRKVFSTQQNSIIKFSVKYITLLTEKVQTGVLIIVISIYTFYTNYQAVIICLIVVSIGLFIINGNNKKLPLEKKVSEKTTNMIYEELMGYVQCLEILPYVNNSVYDKLEQKILENEAAQFKVSRLMNVARSCERLSNIIIILFVSAIFGRKVIQGTYDITALFSIMVLLPKLSDILFRIPVLMANNNELKGIGEVLNELYDMKTIKDERDSLEDKISFIKIENIKVYYGNKLACRMEKFEAQKGDIIGICGKSGCGKSTLVKTLIGLIEDYEGKVSINDRDIRVINRKSIWEHILYLGQEPILLPLGIGVNVSLVDSGQVIGKQLKTAVENIELTEYVNQHGMEDIKGIESMSGGEKQKICIGRCFYHTKDIYILDEATNALSFSVEERIINRLIKKVKAEGSMLILISHNPEIISKCERVYELFSPEVQNERVY